jgi:hypothetical protein
MARAVTIVVLLLVIAGAAAFVAWSMYDPRCSISGTVTRDGKPLEWKTDHGVLLVLFVPLDRERDRNVYRALKTDARTGQYAIDNIPPGSYRVSIQQQDPDSRYDLLHFTLSIKDSPIIKEVTGDEVIDINIAKDISVKRK